MSHAFQRGSHRRPSEIFLPTGYLKQRYCQRSRKVNTVAQKLGRLFWGAMMSSSKRLDCKVICAGFLAVSLTTSAFAQTYSYDSLGRLGYASYPDGTCLTYGYDAAGNRTQYTSTTSPGLVAPAVAISTYANIAANFDPRVGNPTCGALTVSAVGTPAHGTAAITGGGIGVTYTPTTGYTGTDSFTYQVSSGGHSSPNGTITATVNAPTLGPVAYNTSPTWYGGGPAQPSIPTDVTGYVSDPYGYLPTVSSVTQGATGTVTYSGNVVTYRPNNPIPKFKTYTDTYTYTVSDGFGHTATATASVFIDTSAP